MRIKEISEFAEVRTKARAYMCYLMGRNIPTNRADITIDDIVAGLKKLTNEIGRVDSVYVLDPSGRQVTNTVSVDPEFARKGMGENRSNRAYFYRVMKEKRCILTDPYPSLGGNKLVVTASYPVFDDKKNLKYIVCADITLENILKIVHPTSIDSFIGKGIKLVYASFSIALFAVALLLFIKGVDSFISFGTEFKHITIKEMFESTILLTLSLAIFDLVKAIFEEEVLGEYNKHADEDIHKTMVRFLGSIIIALSIEALMLVFKFAIIDPNKLLFAVALMLGIAALMVGLSIYLRAVDHHKKR